MRPLVLLLLWGLLAVSLGVWSGCFGQGTRSVADGASLRREFVSDHRVEPGPSSKAARIARTGAIDWPSLDETRTVNRPDRHRRNPALTLESRGSS
jgi:hypothetical protein